MNALHLSEASNRAEIVVTQAAEYLTMQLNQAADGIFASTSNMLAAQISEANKAAGEAKQARNFAIIAVIIALFLIASFSLRQFLS